MTVDASSLNRRLRLLGNQMMRLANEVVHHDAELAELGPSAIAGLADDSDLWLIAAEDMYRDRRRRCDFFPESLFGEPAWDMLLDLYIAEKKNERVCVTSACLGAQVPSTTGLRWLQLLEERELVERERDEMDARRWFVRISDRGYAQMTAYIAAQRSDWLRDDLTKANDRQRDLAPKAVERHIAA